MSAGRSQKLLPPPVDEPPEYEGYTAERYDRTIARVARFRIWYVAIVAASAAVGLVLIPPFVSPHGPAALRWLTVVWMLPVPVLLVGLVGFTIWFRPGRLLLDPAARSVAVPDPTVHFQITTTGVNAATVDHTARSVLYWTRRHPEVCFQSVVWIFAEEWGYGPNRDVFDRLERDGVQVVVVPAAYRPPGGSLRKSRALQYSVEYRRSLGHDPKDTWVYHHDDETAIGEDTVLGIDEFLRAHQHEPALGMGIILYPQAVGEYRAPFVADLIRAKDDFRNMLTITGKRNIFGGFHGSHYIVRQDVEERVGYDVGRDLIVSEDFYFEVRVREEYGGIFYPIKGFAYEQSPLTVGDQIRQRRRWVWNLRSGWLHLDLPLSRRFMLAYSIATWMCALLSTVLIVGSVLLGFGPIAPVGGLLAGLVWSMMVLNYYVGYSLHREYVPRYRSLARFIGNGIVGVFADGIAVWAGMLTRQRRRFEVIRKDRNPTRTET